MLWWSEGYRSVRSTVLVGITATSVVAACGGESKQKQEPAASLAGRAGEMTTAGRHASGGAGGTGAGRGTSGGMSAGGIAGTAVAGTGQGAQAGGDSAGQAGAGADGGAGGAGGLAGRASGGAGMGAGRGGNGGAGQGATGPYGALTPGVEAYCAATVSCCTPSPSSLEECEASYAEQHSANLVSLMAGAVTVDAEALARCLAAYGGANQCNMNVVWPACRDVMVGTRALGETCRGGNECDRSNGEATCLILDGSDPNALGQCTPAPHAELGEACVSTCALGETCSSTTYGVGNTYALCFEEDGLYCSHADDDAVCQALLPLGSPCIETEQACGPRAYCETTCQALSELGEPCGRACRSELQCGEDDTCIDPTWADPMFGCQGYAPGP